MPPLTTGGYCHAPVCCRCSFRILPDRTAQPCAGHDDPGTARDSDTRCRSAGQRPSSDLDTTLEACEQACLTQCAVQGPHLQQAGRDPASEDGGGQGSALYGAFSAIVVDTPKATIQRAETRKKELSFLNR